MDNGWASNILSGRRCRYPPQSKYWMPTHYDTIKDGQNKKKSHLLFSFLLRIVIFFAFYRRDLLVKNILTSFQWLHVNNYTPYENKCFNPRNQIHHVTFVTCINSVCVQMRHAIRHVQAHINYPAERAIHHGLVINGWSFGQSNEISCWQAKSYPLTNNVSMYDTTDYDLICSYWGHG